MCCKIWMVFCRNYMVSFARVEARVPPSTGSLSPAGWEKKKERKR
jgi:hypothetical protein